MSDRQYAWVEDDEELSAACFTAVTGVGVDEQLARVVEQVGPGPSGRLPPPVEVAGRDHLRADALVEEVVEDVVVDEHTAPAGAVFELADLLDQLAVAGDEGVVRVPVALDEGLADEDLAGGDGVDAAEVDAAPAGESAEAPGAAEEQSEEPAPILVEPSGAEPAAAEPAAAETVEPPAQGSLLDEIPEADSPADEAPSADGSSEG